MKWLVNSPLYLRLRTQSMSHLTTHGTRSVRFVSVTLQVELGVKLTYMCVAGKLKELFDTLDHNEIWVELRGLYVQLGRNYCYKVDNHQQKIRFVLYKFP